MNIEIVVAIIGLIGIVITAILAWWQERVKARRDRLASVYASYIDAVTGSAALQAFLSERQQAGDVKAVGEIVKSLHENRLAFLKAHSNIVIYGSPRVITALNDLYQAQGEGADRARVNSLLIGLITQMRADSNSADYPAYGEHVDNIIGNRADERAARYAQALQRAAAASPNLQAGAGVAISAP